MLHILDNLRDNVFSKENEVTNSTSIVFCCYYLFDNIHPVSYLVMIPWDVIWTAIKGFMVVAIMPMVTTFFQEFYKKKVSPKLFKDKKNAKQKDSNKRAA